MLWALEILTSEKPNLQLVSLKTFFNHAIGVGEVVQFILKTEDETHAEIQLLARNKQVARIRVAYSFSENWDELIFPDTDPTRRDCLDRNGEQLKKASGGLDLCLNQSETKRRFPNLMRVFPSKQLAELMALTRLIGMECPGLHSIFSDLNLSFSNPKDDRQRLNYEVLSYAVYYKNLTLTTIILV